MEHAIEALESATAAIILALAIVVFLYVSNASDKGEKCIIKDMSKECNIIEVDMNE